MKGSLSIQCGLGPESRRQAIGSGIRRVAGGSDAKIRNVIICHLIEQFLIMKIEIIYVLLFYNSILGL